MERPAVVPGLHEDLVTTAMDAVFDDKSVLRAEIAKVDPADQPHVLARHIYELTRSALESRADPDGRIQLLNDLVVLLEVPEARVEAPARQLRRLAVEPGPGVIDSESTRPKTPLSDAALMTKQRGRAESRGRIARRDRYLGRGRPAVRVREVARSPPPGAMVRPVVSGGRVRSHRAQL